MNLTCFRSDFVADLIYIYNACIHARFYCYDENDDI